MRKLRIFEHMSLDGVIEARGSGETDGYPYGDWVAGTLKNREADGRYS